VTEKNVYRGPPRGDPAPGEWFFFGGGGGGGIAYIREWKTMLPAEEPLYGHTHRTDFKRVSRLTL